MDERNVITKGGEVLRTATIDGELFISTADIAKALGFYDGRFGNPAGNVKIMMLNIGKGGTQPTKMVSLPWALYNIARANKKQSPGLFFDVLDTFNEYFAERSFVNV